MSTPIANGQTPCVAGQWTLLVPNPSPARTGLTIRAPSANTANVWIARTNKYAAYGGNVGGPPTSTPWSVTPPSDESDCFYKAIPGGDPYPLGDLADYLTNLWIWSEGNGTDSLTWWEEK